MQERSNGCGLFARLIDPSIDEHGGRIVQTGGDVLLIVFDSIDGAVRGAVSVQQQVPIHDGDQPPDRAIRFRVGINLGDAIADGTDLHGDAVNVAARLQAECPPGGICVSPQYAITCMVGSIPPRQRALRLRVFRDATIGSDAHLPADIEGAAGPGHLHRLGMSTVPAPGRRQRRCRDVASGLLLLVARRSRRPDSRPSPVPYGSRA